jgi:hypothetical protein
VIVAKCCSEVTHGEKRKVQHREMKGREGKGQGERKALRAPLLRLNK